MSSRLYKMFAALGPSDAAADLGQLRRLLVDLDVETGATVRAAAEAARPPGD